MGELHRSNNARTAPNLATSEGACGLHAEILGLVSKSGVPMSEKTLRWLVILDALERKGMPLTSEQIKDAIDLEWGDLQCDIRTIQRDLQGMRAVDSLGVDVVDADANPLQWQVRNDSTSPRLMGVDSAAALKLILRHVEGLLPDELLHPMRKQLERADAVLAREARNNPAARSLDRRIRMVPLGYSLLPPAMEPGLLQRVFEAMRKGCKITAGYRNQTASEPKRRTFSVLGLVLRPPKYQVVAYDGKERVYTMLLHRMSGAILEDAQAEWPQGFDLDQWLQEGESDVALQGTTEVVLEVNDGLARAWSESPLGPELTVRSLDEGEGSRLTVRLPITEAFRAYLLSFGAQVRIIEPQWLRDWQRDQARAILDGKVVESSGKPEIPPA